MIQNISVIGLGKLGASMLAGMASRGFHVIGVDITESSVRAVNEGRAPVQETGLEEMISAHRDKVRATTSHEEAVLGSDISFVIVPTPSDSRGAFELQYAKYAFEQLGKALAKKDSYHVIVLTSTVIPGATRHGLLPVLEAASGKKCGKDFGLCYGPEFIALGSVIRDFLNPDFYLVGEFDQRSGDVLEEVNRKICVKEPVVHRMSIENAEIAKIALNSYVTMKISFANTLADLCERIPGGDVDVVSDAIGSDTRIGRKYLTGGLGFGGPCFPRDNVALGFLCEHVGADGDLLVANHGYNKSMATRITAKIAPLLQMGQTAAVLGLSYKPLSHVVEESQGVALALAMAEAGMRVIGYDPLASDGARSAFRDKALVAESIECRARRCRARCRDHAGCSLPSSQGGGFSRRQGVGHGRRLLALPRSKCDESPEDQLRATWPLLGRCPCGSRPRSDLGELSLGHVPPSFPSARPHDAAEPAGRVGAGSSACSGWHWTIRLRTRTWSNRVAEPAARSANSTGPYPSRVSGRSAGSWSSVDRTGQEYPMSVKVVSPRLLLELVRAPEDVLVIYELGLVGLYAGLSKLFRPHKVVSLVEGDYRHIGRAGTAFLKVVVRRLAARFVDVFVANNPPARDYLIRTLNVPEEKIIVGWWLAGMPADLAAHPPAAAPVPEGCRCSSAPAGSSPRRAPTW